MLSLGGFALRLADGYSVLLCAFMITDSLGCARSALNRSSLFMTHRLRMKALLSGVMS